MLFKRILLFSISTLSIISANSQVTGGQFAFESLRLPNAPQVSSWGGMSIANPTEDISIVLQNPALMRPLLHNQLSIASNRFFSGISNNNLTYGYYAPKVKTSFALSIQYVNYGEFANTDANGNTLGSFKANDFCMSASVSKKYKERWHYGSSLKYAQSKLGTYSANALLFDVGIAYIDTANYFTFGAVAKNMGVMMQQYTNGKNNSEPLPFDLQIGISKRFKHLPLRLFTTVHHLYEWDIRYNNPNDISKSVLLSNTDTTVKKNNIDNLFRHFIFGAQITIAKRVALTVSYNHLRRQEMTTDAVKGATGYAFGTDIYLNKFQVHYTRSFYSIGNGYNEFGINLLLNKIIPTQNSTWNASYANGF